MHSPTAATASRIKNGTWPRSSAMKPSGPVKKIVHPGGMVPDLPEKKLSAHLRSRAEVGRIPAPAAPTIELRAGVIIGSGSASFEMLRYLTERLPVSGDPRWVKTRTQPIAVRDVLYYLVGAMEAETVNRPTTSVDRTSRPTRA